MSTAKEVLGKYLHKDVRVRLFYGDKETGVVWLEEYAVIGYIGKSTGREPCLLLVYNSRSTGGNAILVDRVLRIQVGREVVWQHESYKEPVFELREASKPLKDLEYTTSVFRILNGEQVDEVNVANFKSKEKAERWVDFMLGKRMSK